jgi:hypothetical protein
MSRTVIVTLIYHRHKPTDFTNHYKSKYGFSLSYLEC